MIVVDASVVVDLLLRRPRSVALEERLFRGGESWHAPQLVDLEVAQVLRRFERTGELDAERAAEAMADLVDLPLRRHPHLPLLERIWALRGNATAYDAAYLTLAEALAAPLVTRDRKLARVPGTTAVVEVV